jgi:tetratricopeptide (TPR) repeat protein
VASLCLAALAAPGIYLAYPVVRSALEQRVARQALEQQDLTQACAYLERSLTFHPGSASGHFLLAQTLRRAGEFDPAREQLKAAQALGWQEDDVRLEEALMQAQSGVVEPVEGTLQGHLAAGTGDPQLIFEALVRGCLQAQFVPRAYQYSNLWTTRFPDSWHARYWHGRVLEQGLQFDLAAEAYERVLEQRPEHLEARLHCGQALQMRGRPAAALPHLTAYLERRPDDPAALLSLARCQHSLRPPAETRETLDRLFALSGEHPEGWLLRGQLELNDGRPDDALPWLEKARQRIPHDLQLNLALATTLHQLRRFAEAKRYEQRHGEIERDLRRMEDLIKEINTQPRDVSLRYEAGTTLVRLGQDGQAIRWFVSALLLHPRHQPTRQALAGCIQRLGDPKLTDAYRALLATPPEREGQVP